MAGEVRAVAKGGQLRVTLRSTVAKDLATPDRVTGVVIPGHRFLGKDNMRSEIVRLLFTF